MRCSNGIGAGEGGAKAPQLIWKGQNLPIQCYYRCDKYKQI